MTKQSDRDQRSAETEERPDDLWYVPSPAPEWRERPPLGWAGAIAVIATVLAFNPLTWLLVTLLITS